MGVDTNYYLRDINWYFLVRNTTILIVCSCILARFGSFMFYELCYSISSIYDMARNKFLQLLAESEMFGEEIDLGNYDADFYNGDSDDEADDSDDDIYYEAVENEEDLQTVKEPRRIEATESRVKHHKIIREHDPTYVCGKGGESDDEDINDEDYDTVVAKRRSRMVNHAERNAAYEEEAAEEADEEDNISY